MSPRSHPATRSDDIRTNGQLQVERRQAREQWLKDHRSEVAHMSETALALRLRKEGLYSKRTAIIDISISIARTCSRLGLPYRGCMMTRHLCDNT